MYKGGMCKSYGHWVKANQKHQEILHKNKKF